MTTLPAQLHEPDWSALTEAETDAIAERVEDLRDCLHRKAGYIIQAVFRDDGELCLLVSETVIERAR